MSGSPINSTIETLADYSSSDLIVIEVEDQTADAVLHELCSVLCCKGHVPDGSRFNQAVLARESISSTSFVNGWALPHARMSDIPELKFALARTAKPVRWFGHPAATIQTVFLFAVPEDGARDYLNVVRAIARLSQSASLIQRLNVAASAKAIFYLLQEAPLARPRAPRANNGNSAGHALRENGIL